MSEEREMINEVREWLVRIDTNQEHQTQLLEALNQQAENTYEKADQAEEIAQKALEKAQANEKQIDNEKVTRRWIIGTAIGLFVSLIPIFNSFYL